MGAGILTLGITMFHGFDLEAQTSGGGLTPDHSPVQTACIVESTGEIVGYANDCTPGNGNCIDTSCTSS